MKEQNKNGWLLPLGIGAGVLLLITGLKNKATAALATGGDKTLPLTSDEPIVPGQINPAPAPSYTQSHSANPQDSYGGEDARQHIQDGEDDGMPSQPEQASYDTDNGEEAQDTDADGSEEDNETDADTTHKNATPHYVSSKQPSYRPGATVSAGNRSVAYRPGASNPKQIRFDNRAANTGNKPSIKAYADQSSTSAAKPFFKVTSKPSMRQSAIPRNTGIQTLQPVQASNIKAVSTAKRPATIFPLRMGSSNSYVKELQRRIGVAATGYFGTSTLATVRKRYGVSEVSETLYRQIITGKAVVYKPAVKTIVRQKPLKRKNMTKRQPVPAQKNSVR